MGGFAGMGPVLNGAASQFDRRLDGPAPETVRVDGRSLADLLVFAAEYGRLINFYDLTDKADGDWTEFFASDPSIAFALLVSLDLSCVERQLRRDLRDLRRRSGRDSDRHPWHRLSTALRRLIHLLDRGHAPLWTGGAALARGIRKDIRMELAPRLRSLAIHLADGGAESGFRLDLGELSGVWSIFPGLAEPAAGPPVNRVWFECLVPLLEDLVDALLAALGRVAADARKALEETLLTDDHAPQTALYIAFAELFRHAQRTVNGFSHRLVDFYDARILRQHDRATVPGEVYLTFTTAQGVTSTVIPVGTLFPAGTDDTGAPINYAASDSLPVHAVTLSELRTLQVAEGLLVARGNSPTDTPVRTGVFTGTVALSDQPPAIETPFPLFGDKVAGTTGVLTTTPATLGFAVASDTLMLTGGARSVTVGLTVTSDSLAVVTPLLESIAPQAGNVDWPTLLAQILQAAFSLSYSTGGGWVPIPGYTVTPPAARSEDMSASAGGDITFTLTFSLDDGAAPFIALSTAPVSADAVAPPADMSAPVQDLPALPTLRAIFRQDSVTVGQGGQTVTIFPYAVLWPVRLSGLSIAVSVKGFTNLTLSSPSGLLDAGTPFALFGSPPVQGASLDIAAPELFVKRLGSLDLSLGWFGLPQTTTGFQGYYQGYVVNPDGDTVPPGTLFTNQSFQTTLCVINPGWWTLALPAGDTDAQPSYLFRTDIGNAVPTADEPALPETAFDGLPVTDTEPPASYDPAAGAIRLSLVAPTYAFGDTLYASNVMAAALREMPAASACADLCARQCAHLAEVAAAAGLLDPVQTANADASDDQYAASVSSAVDKALSSLTGVALKMVDDGLATLTPEEAGAWQDSLAIALSQSGSGGRRKLLQRLFGNGKRPTPSTVCASLQEWIATNADAIGATAQGDLARARSTLDAAGRIADTRALTSDQPPAVARPVLGAALLGARSDLTQPYADALQDCLAKCQGGSSDKYYPNQPWLPTASAVSLNYTAADVLPDSPGGAYGYILPFGGTALVAWKVGDTVSLLAPIEQPGALYIGLDGVPEGKPPTLTLLFQLSDVIVGEVTDSATVSWAESFDKGWSALVAPDGLQCDGTDGMRHSGIVKLGVSGLTATVGGLAWLRLGVDKDADAFPRLGGLTLNALSADWVGPGGAGDQDTPVPAGSITTSAPALNDIGSIGHHMPSSGGRAKAVGPAFRIWMAERLRHKNRGIQGWDYSRLVLADFPTLWQVAVLMPGDDPALPQPGQVRLVVVVGPSSPDVSDPTVPCASDTLRTDVEEMLKPLISPFVTLSVENPFYVRVKVTAEVVFRDVATLADLTGRLNADLIGWLSPWPTPALGRRPTAYWMEVAIADFIRRRPYVVEILTLSLSCHFPDGRKGCHYFTSALEHDLSESSVESRRSAGTPATNRPATGEGAPA